MAMRDGSAVVIVSTISVAKCGLKVQKKRYFAFLTALSRNPVVGNNTRHSSQQESQTMAFTSSRKASLQSMEAEIESLLKSLEGLKSDASDESRKTLKNLKANAESALSHSRSLLSDVYEDVKVKTRETSVATRDYAQEHPWTTAGVAVGAIGLLAAYLLCKRG
jgi:ElaB/YqjD/DUF883 family membrane-anchored ribosome-binding protein